MMRVVSHTDLARFLAAAEAVSPAAAVPAAARYLQELLGAEHVRYWVADAAGDALIEVDGRTSAPVAGSPAGTAWRSQHVVADGAVWVPVTVRGDALGVLEVGLPGTGEALADEVAEALTVVAHFFGYVVVANQRHTDAYEVARRSRPFELSMEVQRRLLPQAFVCEGGAFSLAGWLEPSSRAGGDTFDYIASEDRLTLTLIDAVGHDVTAALLATLTVNAMRNARRAGALVESQADAAHAALEEHAAPEQFATGVLLEAPLSGTGPDAEAASLRLVNAGHPAPLLLRDGRVSELDVPRQPPLGVALQKLSKPYEAHEVEVRPGDRLLLVTDGLLERTSADLGLERLLLESAGLHPRNAAQDIARAYRCHVGDRQQDDATLVVLDWHGGSTARSTTGGADTG